MKFEAVIEHLKICRIDHWLKNIFIVFGHVVAVVLYYDLELPGDLIGSAILSLVPVCLVASAYYILNEILDAPFDAQHPKKKHRGIPAGKVSVPVLWVMMGVLLITGFALAWFLFPNKRYFASLAVLMFCACLYNIPPIRLKDKAFLDVITESFNNPLRLWLGWYALMPADEKAGPPLAIVLAWWSFGALLMTGKRYAEYRFIGDAQRSGMYRASFKVYNEQRLIMAMITYANLFCFCTGIALTDPENAALTNLILVFPMILLAVVAYFSRAMSEVGAKLEPEQLMRNPPVLISILFTCVAAFALLWAHKTGALTGEQILNRL